MSFAEEAYVSQIRSLTRENKDLKERNAYLMETRTMIQVPENQAEVDELKRNVAGLEAELKRFREQEQRWNAGLGVRADMDTMDSIMRTAASMYKGLIKDNWGSESVKAAAALILHTGGASFGKTIGQTVKYFPDLYDSVGTIREGDSAVVISPEVRFQGMVIQKGIVRRRQ